MDATVELLRGGDLRPSSTRVARRAGVSRRLVFHYFSRIDALLGRAVETYVTRQLSMVAPVPARLPLDRRIEVTCKERRVLYEANAPVLLAAGWMAERTIPWRARPTRPRPAPLAGLRDHLAVTFAPEIRRAGAGGRALLVDLDVMSGWEQWQALRTRLGLTPSEAQRWMERQFHHHLDSR